MAASKQMGQDMESALPTKDATAADAQVQAQAEADDGPVVERAVKGDGSAFEELFTRHRQRVFAAAWRLLRDEDAALDVVQDAFLKAYEQLDKFRGDGRFYPWIRRIAINLSIDRLRHIKRGVEIGLDERRVGSGEETDEGPAGVVFAKDGGASPLKRAEMSEFSAAFGEAIQKLSEAHRTVFMLHAAEGLSYKEIADTLGLNMGTVMSRLFYARKHLQEMLGAHLK